jgi:hypothetical protein
MRCASSLEDMDSLLCIAFEEDSCCGHGMDSGRELQVGFLIWPIGIVLVWVAPVADFETELTMMGFAGGHTVKFGEPAFLAVCS